MSPVFPRALPRRLLAFDRAALEMRVHRDWRDPPLQCDECGGEPVLLAGNETIYRRVRGEWPYVYVCVACRAYVGLHRGSLFPLGTMASGATRAARAALHAAFDPLWQSGRTSRRRAYKALARALGLSAVHISELTLTDCTHALTLIPGIEADLTPSRPTIDNPNREQSRPAGPKQPSQ